MQIAACYIVKNEAEELDRSIQSLQNAIDELVVVDTGSEDATVEIAKSYNARILSFPWQDHFAKARNFALEHVESPWIIFLDADEFFRHPKEVRPTIYEELGKTANLDAIMLTRYNMESGSLRTDIPYDISLRILRNAPELRYHGRIHELLKKTKGPLNLSYADERLSLNHTGYSSAHISAKIQRNLALLQRDIEENGKSPAHDHYLSECYFGLHDYKKALAHATQALDTGLLLIGSQGSLYHIAIESMRQLDMPLQDMLALTHAAIRELPELPEFYAEQGMVLCAMGRLGEAAEMLAKAMEIFDSTEINHRQSSYFTKEAAAIACKRLGEIAQIRGSIDSAAHWFQRALQLDGRNSEIQSLCRSFRKKYPQYRL